MNPVFVARQHSFLIGVFTSLEKAQKECQAHYDRYVQLYPALEPGMLQWTHSDFSSVPRRCIASPNVYHQASYQVDAIDLDKVYR